MRTVLMSGVALFLVIAPAYAADEFGDRFGTSAPMALADEESADMGLGNILGLEPAAGEEEDGAETQEGGAEEENAESEEDSEGGAEEQTEPQPELPVLPKILPLEQ
jgi:hypothetical protein